MQCTLIPADEGPEHKPKVLFASSTMPAPVHVWRHPLQKEGERNHFSYRAPQGRALILIFPSLTFLISSSNFFWWLLSIYILLLNIHQRAAAIFTAPWVTGCIHLLWRASVNENSAGELSDYQQSASKCHLHYWGDLRYLWYKIVYELLCWNSLTLLGKHLLSVYWVNKMFFKSSSHITCWHRNLLASLLDG